MMSEKKLSKTFYNIFSNKIPFIYNNIPFRYTSYTNTNSINAISRLKTSHSSSLLNSHSIIMDSFFKNQDIKKLKYILRKKMKYSHSKEKINNRNLFTDYLHEKMAKNFSKIHLTDSFRNYSVLNSSKKLKK